MLELSKKDKDFLNSLSDGLGETVDSTIKKLEFPIINDKLENSKKLSSKTLSDETRKILKDFAYDTFFLADEKILFSLNKALIDHQLRNIQYYRLFNKFNKFNLLSEEEKKNLEHYKEKLEEALIVHDSDKLDEKDIIEHYISQEFITKISNIEENLKTAFKHIAAAMRRIHGDMNRHHNDYYNYHPNEVDGITKYIILEHVIDVISIGDKRLENIGDFYSKKKDVCFNNFSKHNDRLITEIYNLYKNIFNSVENLKAEREKLKAELKVLTDKRLKEEQTRNANESNENLLKIDLEIKNKQDTLKNLNNIIRENTEEIVWQEMEDGFDNSMNQVKELEKNLYFAIEDEWKKAEKTKEGKENVLKYFSEISNQKRNAFNRNFSLLEELKKLSLKASLLKESNGEVKDTMALLKISSILQSLKSRDSLNQNPVINDMLKNDNVAKKVEYIEQRNKQSGDNFYIASR